MLSGEAVASDCNGFLYYRNMLISIICRYHNTLSHFARKSNLVVNMFVDIISCVSLNYTLKFDKGFSSNIVVIDYHEPLVNSIHIIYVHVSLL